jgi:hypothetical protein
MMQTGKKRKAQSTMEYMMLLIILIGALLAVGGYFQRGIMGRWKASVDSLGDQYNALNTNADITQTASVLVETTIQTIPDAGGYWTMRRDDTNSLTQRTTRTVGP